MQRPLLLLEDELLGGTLELLRTELELFGTRTDD